MGGSSVLDSDYLTMLSSSDKLMSGEFEALERLQAELDLFDDPNRPEEIVEQMAVENHLDLIEEEVCSDTGDSMISEVVPNIKNEIINLVEEDIQSGITETEIKKESIENEEFVTVKQSQTLSQPAIGSASGSTATKRSAPLNVQGNLQSKKSVR